MGRRLAEQALDALVRSVESDVGDLTVSGAIDRYEVARRDGWSPSTQRSHRWHVESVVAEVGAVVLADLRASRVQDLYDGWSRQGCAAGTVRRRHGVLAAAMHHAVARGWILRSPTDGVELPTVGRVLRELPSYAVVAAGIGRLPAQQRRLQVVAGLALASGARRGELLALRWADLDLDRATMRVRAAVVEGPDGLVVRKGTKTGSVRTVDLDEVVVADLRRWRSEVHRAAIGHGVAVGTNGPVFGSLVDVSVPVLPTRVGQDWHRWRGTIGLAGLRFHDLRHRYATTLLEQGVPVHHVAQRLGHANPTMTLAVYAHAIPGGDRAGAGATAAARTLV